MKISQKITPCLWFDDSEKSQRAMQAMLQMKKIDINELKRVSAQ